MGTGQLLEAEEPKLYGLWDGVSWWRDHSGIIFHTVHLRAALATALSLDHPYAECVWSVGEIGPNGMPVKEEKQC